MARWTTGKNGITALAALVTKKTFAPGGDGAETNNLENVVADATTQVLLIEDFEHNEIHAGDHYYFTDAHTINAASSDAIDYMFVVPNTTKWPHITFDADGTQITSFGLYENCVQSTSDGWTQETVFNNNRNSGNTAGMQIWSKNGDSDPTSDFGTLIWEYSSGLSTNQSKIPVVQRSGREKILRQGIKYIFRILSGSAGNLVNFIIRWYEHQNS
jgi:hypothetical protein